MTTTLKMTPQEIARLREQLEGLGFDFRSLDHAHFQARGEGAVVAAYRSGKVVVQGKGAGPLLGRLDLEPGASAGGGEGVLAEITVGSDESGKGDYFGPMTVAAVVVRPDQVADLARAGVRDSKSLGQTGALRAAAAVRRLCPHAVRVLQPPEYNERHAAEGNVALFLSRMHAQVIAEASRAAGECKQVVIDQFTFADRLERDLRAEGVDLPVEIRPKAESNPAVAAASVLARAEFLLQLRELGHPFGIELPRGASANVERVARSLFKAGGMKVLRSVAKVHFRTTERVTGLF